MAGIGLLAVIVCAVAVWWFVAGDLDRELEPSVASGAAEVQAVKADSAVAAMQPAPVTLKHASPAVVKEATFGDPDNRSDLNRKDSKEHGVNAAGIERRNTGLADLLSDKLGADGAISSILSDNPHAFEDRMAARTAGTGDDGRIHGMGFVDKGGGKGMRAGLGKKGVKKVGKMQIISIGSQGFCQKGNIESVVKQRVGAMRACYEQELQLHGGLAGKVVIRWTIDPEGRVDGTSISNSNLGNDKVERCVMTTIRRMRFAKPDSGICVVQFSLVVSPK